MTQFCIVLFDYCIVRLLLLYGKRVFHLRCLKIASYERILLRTLKAMDESGTNINAGILLLGSISYHICCGASHLAATWSTVVRHFLKIRSQGLGLSPPLIPPTYPYTHFVETTYKKQDWLIK